MRINRRHVLRLGCLVTLLCVALPVRAEELDKLVLDAQAQRIAAIERIRPAVVAIFARGGQGGGSGVLISPDGYALTNYHVVASTLPAMQCGLPDGVLYDAVIVGIDKVGDVALIKLLPKEEGWPFPCATLGDSDKVRPGEWTLAMGNPFLLATDFTPTVSFGLVSGVHRYQYPESTRGLLEYTDCIQIDTSINPGNSGGPLFNMAGELIGINGRISIEKRGRVNSGVGYAISINQIKNFLGHLKAGLEADHATTGFTVESDNQEETTTRLLVRSVLADSDAERRGIDEGDELVSFTDRPMKSVNQYKNVLGIYPKGWRVPFVFRRNNDRQEMLVRLLGVQRQEAREPRPQRPRPGQPREPQPELPAPSEVALKLYEAKTGFANYYFNKLERDRLWTGFRKHGDFASLAGDWTIEADLEIKGQSAPGKFVIRDERDKDGAATRTLVSLSLGGIKYELDPLRTGQDILALKDPPGSGGLLMALYHYRRLLTQGEKGFEGNFSHGGQEPFYPSPVEGVKPKSYQALRVDTEVMRTEHAATPVKWFFSLQDQSLLGFEVVLESSDDPCEVYFYDYKPVNGRKLPGRIEVRHGNGRFGVLRVKSYDLAAAK